MAWFRLGLIFYPKFDKPMRCVKYLNATSLLALVLPESQLDLFLLSVHVCSSVV